MGKIKIAVVGLNFGKHILSQLQSDIADSLFEITAVCDVDETKVREISEQYGVRAYLHLDDLLLDGEVEAIALFTGPAGRAELIGRIIDAGKHVMTTKPFEVDADKALQILHRAKSLGKIVHLNSPSPLLPPDLRQVKEWIQSYNLGQFIGCRSDVWASYREKHDGSWYDDPDKCPVAPIFRLGIYLVNDLVQLFGKANSVQVMQSRIFTGRPTPDNAQLGILLESGAICNIFASFCISDGQSYKNSLIMNFERGTIYRNIEPLRSSEFSQLSHLSMMARDADKNVITEYKQVSAETHSNYQWDVFYRAVRSGDVEVDASPESIAEGIKIISAMARAEKSGRTELIE